MERASTGPRTERLPLDEHALAEHGRRFLEATTDLLVIGEIGGGVLWVNEARWERTLGVPGSRMLGLGYLDLLHPDDRDETLDAVARVGDGKEVSNLNRYRRVDGSYRWLLWDSIADREAGRIYCLAKDITELKESQQELTESRGRLAEVQRVSHLGSWEWRPGSGEVHWSDELYRIFRLDPGEYEPSYEAYLDLVHPADRESLAAAIQQLLDTGEPYELSHRVRLRDGEERVILCRTKLDPEEGEPRVTGACQDVTEAVEAEAELARTISLKEATLESTADGILVVDTDGSAVSWNRNFVEMWRIPEEVMESRDDDAMLESVLSQLRDPETFLSRVRELYAHPDQESFDVMEFKDGRLFERFSKPQRLDGEVVGRVWSFRDVTDRLRAERENLALEARLQQSQRLESLGRLAGGIAHDFNNHLVAILNYAALAGEELPEGTTGRDDLDEVIRAAERASALTRELVAFSRQEMIEPRPLLLNALVADTERLLRRTIGEDIELRVELGRNLPAIEADPSQLERVLINLAVNARDAMPDGGTLAIETEAVEGGGGDGELAGLVVRLRVTDDGTGMSEDVVRRALEPFFTTKPSGEGTGLGLATVYGIVNQSGGAIEIHSRPGEGTTIEIDLPASERVPDPPAQAVSAESKPVRRGTVLVVEDEAPVRRLTARLLRDAGFRTLEAARGDEALAILDSDDARELCLLLTDIVMPQMSGRELAERAHATRAELPVLFMSGYTDDVVVRHGVATDELPFLPKPFTRETLIAAVNEAIESVPSAG